MKFLLFFIVIPLIELYVLIQVGSEWGALNVVLWTVVGAILGLVLMRQQGLATMQEAQLAMVKGEPVQGALMNGVFVFLGGLLLFLPGLISDVIGLILLVPFIRSAMISQAVKGMNQRGKNRAHRGQSNVYDGDWQEKQPESPKVLEGEVVSNSKDSKKD
ncbi:FxsA family protein [Thiomicrorhabdus indica]|jgi:UPF0716 protein FxsA|uniref:FxsA family protein n=1 Tax=Thiomicrorhabdus indica TaxID=2267253 RepID=UPI00102D8D42|nr:FxsA family protein [Thiomicrorhabdus indica]